MSPAAWLPGALVNGAEAAVLALLVWGITRRIRHAAVTHILWCAVLVDLVAPPLLTIPLARIGLRSSEPRLHQDAEESAAGVALADHELAFAVAPPEVPSGIEDLSTAPEVSEAPEASSLAGPARDGLDLAAFAWIGGSLAFLIVTLVRGLAFHRSLRSARSAPPALRDVIADRSRRAGLSRPPEVLLVEGRLPPLVWAFCGRARLILPASLLDRLGALQVEMLIAHEVAHLARRDHWLRWPETFIVSLYWWCPIAWWARSRLRRAEEDCCDGHVREAFPGAPLEYAKALMETVDFLSGSRAIPTMASGLGREGRLLKRRFDMILDQAPGHRLSRPLRAVLIASLAALVPLSPGIIAGDDDDPERGDGKPTDTAEKPDLKDPTNTKEGAGKGDWARKAPNEEMEARLASLEKQVAALLEEIKSGRAEAEAHADSGEKRDYPVKGTPGWKKWEENPLVAGGRVYHIEKNVLSAIDPKSSKDLWVTKLPFSDPKIQVSEKVVQVTDGENTLVLDGRTGKILRKGFHVYGEDKGSPGYVKEGTIWKKNHLPGVSGSDDKVRPEKNELPRVSNKIPTLEHLRAEKQKLRDRLAEIEAMEAKLEAANRYYRPAAK